MLENGSVYIRVKLPHWAKFQIDAAIDRGEFGTRQATIIHAIKLWTNGIVESAEKRDQRTRYRDHAATGILMLLLRRGMTEYERQLVMSLSEGALKVDERTPITLARHLGFEDPVDDIDWKDSF